MSTGRNTNGVPALVLDLVTTDGGWLHTDIIVDHITTLRNVQPATVTRALDRLAADGQLHRRSVPLTTTRHYTEWRAP